jgi:hypothetical protein
MGGGIGQVALDGLQEGGLSVHAGIPGKCPWQPRWRVEPVDGLPVHKPVERGRLPVTLLGEKSLQPFFRGRTIIC